MVVFEDSRSLIGDFICLEICSTIWIPIESVGPKLQFLAIRYANQHSEDSVRSQAGPAHSLLKTRCRTDPEGSYLSWSKLIESPMENPKLTQYEHFGLRKCKDRYGHRCPSFAKKVTFSRVTCADHRGWQHQPRLTRL